MGYEDVAGEDVRVWAAPARFLLSSFFDFCLDFLEVTGLKSGSPGESSEDGVEMDPGDATGVVGVVIITNQCLLKGNIFSFEMGHFSYQSINLSFELLDHGV